MALRQGDKYDAILDAAEIVIARQGYHSAQISRIAAEAGVAAGTVYLYFRDKPDVLVSLFRDRLGKLMAEARRHFSGVTDPGERLHQFIRHHLQALSCSRDLAVVTQIELRQADARVQQEISQIMQGYFQLIDEIIADGQRAGVFRPVDRKQMRNLVFGTLDQTVTAWVLSGFRFDLQALAEMTFELIVGGLSGTEPRRSGQHGDSSVA